MLSHSGRESTASYIVGVARWAFERALAHASMARRHSGGSGAAAAGVMVRRLASTSAHGPRSVSPSGDVAAVM